MDWGSAIDEIINGAKEVAFWTTVVIPLGVLVAVLALIVILKWRR